MNRNLYRTIFSERLGMMVAVPEIMRACTKRSGSSSGTSRSVAPTADPGRFHRPGGYEYLARCTLIALAVGRTLWGQQSLAAPPLPTGGTITQGTGNITQSGNTLTVTQSSQSLAANWQTFDISYGNAVVFKQPNSSSVALNRVIGPDASTIYGSLSSNGKVFLVNPNGVLFAPGAQVSVGGLIASTLNISDDDFAAGRYRFVQGDGPTGSVVNQGNLNAGSVALIGPQVINTGSITTLGGNTTLAAGRQVMVELLANGLLTAQVDVAAANAEVQNHGKIVADGGSVSVQAGRADTVLNTLINTDGVIQARSIRNQNGTVYLDAGAGGAVTVSGTVDASAPDSPTGGSVRVLGEHVTLASGARIDVSGQESGGTALIGGDLHGGDPEVLNASSTTVQAGAAIHADGAQQGGRVVVWSDDATQFAGEITAHGKGFAEVSGKGSLRFSGSVDTGGGTLLLDPTDITVQSTNGDQTSTFSGSQIATLLGSNDVVLDASNNITWNSGATLDYNGIGSTGRTLTLQAGNNIAYSGKIYDSVAGADNLNVVFDANFSGGGTGRISITSGASIATSGGNILLRGGSAALTALPAFTDPSYVSALTATAANGIAISSATLDAGGGNITMRGIGTTATGPGVSIAGTSSSSLATVQTSGVGTITIDGLGGTVSTGFNRGIFTTYASISSVDGALMLQGTGNGGTATENSGARIDTGTTVQATGAGNVTINGLGSTGSNFNDGMVLEGATVRVNNGNLTMTGTGRGTGLGSDGIELAVSSLVEATGSGSVTFNGTSTATGANTDRGVAIWLSSTVRTTSGALTLQGSSANPATGNGIELGGNGIGTLGRTSQSGAITLTADTMNFAGGSIQGSGSLLIQPLTPAASIGLGSGSTGTLNLTSSEIALIRDGFSSITIGRSDGSGAVDVRTATFNDPVTIRTPASPGSIAVSGTLSNGGVGPGGITLQAGGDVSLNSGTVNTADAINLSGNTYTVTGNGALTSNTLALGNTNGISDTGTLTLNQTVDTTLANAIGGTGNLVKLGANTLTLTGNNAYSGATTISAGTIQVGTGGMSGTLGTGAVVNNGNLAFNRSDALTVANTISGTGAVTQAGTGTTTLAGTNTYSGVTAVNAGTLAITNSAGLGDTTGGTTVATGAALDLQNVAVGAESITLAGGALRTSVGTSSLSGAVALPSTGVFDVGPGAELTVSGVISGGGGLTKINSGTLVLSGANTYTGLTNLSIGGGTVAVTNDSALGSASAGVSLHPGTTLDLRNVTIADSIVANTGDILVSTGASTLTGNISGFNSLPLNVFSGAQLTMTGVTVSAASLVKNGGGTLTLTGNNTSPGATTINAGTVRVGDGGTTGTLTRGAVTVASGANLIFDRSDSVSLSTLANNAAGITGAGNVTALIGGGFTVDRPIALTGATSNILLEAGKDHAAGDSSGGDITLTSALSTSATGTVTIFSGNANTAALDAQVSGATGATRYKTYDVSAASTNGTISGTRNYYYRQAPSSLSVNGLTATKVYDGLVDATSALDGSSAIVAGLIDGDALGYGALTIASATFDSAHAGTRTVNASFSGPTPTYSGGGAAWSVSGYSTADLTASGSATITPRPITTPIDAVGKTYDGLTSTASTLGAPTGFAGGDSASGLAGMVLAFDAPNAGSRNVIASGSGSFVSFTGVARGNGSGQGVGNEVAGLASDYSIVTPSPASAVINPAPLTIMANSDAKILTQSDTAGYNGVSYSGFVHGEDPSVLSGTLSISRSNAGTESAGTYTGVLAPSGLSASNYTISYANGNYQILPAQELLVKIANVTNSYSTSVGYAVTSAAYLDSNGTTLHALTQTAQNGNTYTYSDGVGGSVTFTVTPQGVVISSAGYLAVGNYALAGTDTHIGGNNFLGLSFVGNQAVTPIALAPLPSAGISKVYDGTTAMTGLTMGFTGELSGDTVFGNGNGAFSSKNAGSNLNYNISNVTLMGADAHNYYLTTDALSGNNGLITPKPITVSGVIANDKIYDGTTAATLVTSATLLNDVLSGDSVTLDATSYTAMFGNKNVSSGKAVAVTGFGLAGTDAGNYTLTQPSNLTASITPRSLTITAVSDTRIYDGTTNSSLTPTMAGLVSGDTVSGAAAQAFDNRNAGTGKTLAASLGSLMVNDGNGGGNYALSYVNDTTGVIAPRTLTVSAVSDSKIYDGTVSSLLNPAISGLAAGDSVSGTAVQSFDNRNAGTGKALAAAAGSLVVNDGNGGNNYAVTFVNDTTGVIDPRPLILTATPNSKTYDGTANAVAAPTVTGELVGGDRFNLLGEHYASAQSGTGLKLIPLFGIDDGNGGANYAVTLVDSNAGEIFPAAPPVDTALMGGGNLVSRLTGDSATSLEAGMSAGEGSRNARTSSTQWSTPGMEGCERSAAADSHDSDDHVAGRADNRARCAENAASRTALIQVHSSGIRLPQGLASGEAFR